MATSVREPKTSKRVKALRSKVDRAKVYTVAPFPSYNAGKFRVKFIKREWREHDCHPKRGLRA